MKLCQIYNYAAHYRAEIFQLMDQTFDCDYVFGASLGDIKQMDTSVLRGNVTKVKNKKIGHFYWQPHVISLLGKGYDTYLILGDTRCLSTWMFCLIARLLYRKKRIFFWSHGWYGKETKAEKILKKIFFRLPNGGTFLYGNYARQLMIEEGFNPDKLFVIHNSLAYQKQLKLRTSLTKSNIYQQHFNNDYPVIIVIGRLTKRKRLDMLFDGMTILKSKGTLFNAVLVGAGEEEERLKKYANRCELSNHVWFYGACYNEEENAQLIYNADLCVMPGDIGLTAIHCMMFGTPCITHNEFQHQGPEFEAINDGETGSFFKAGDTEELANSIGQWFNVNANRRERVRQACYNEIDTQWNPQFQIEVLKKHFF